MSGRGSVCRVRVPSRHRGLHISCLPSQLSSTFFYFRPCARDTNVGPEARASHLRSPPAHWPPQQHGPKRSRVHLVICASPVSPAGPLPAIIHEADRFAGNTATCAVRSACSLCSPPLSPPVLQTPSSVIKPNTHKDLPTSLRLAAIGGSSGAFWGGQTGAARFVVTLMHAVNAVAACAAHPTLSALLLCLPGAFKIRDQAEHAQDLPTLPWLAAIGGDSGAFWGSQVGCRGLRCHTRVHTTLILETTEQGFRFWNRPAAAATSKQPTHGQVLSQLNGAAGGFDSFSDTNPFTLKTLDAYRMQLWNRIAMQAQQQRAHAPAPNSAKQRKYVACEQPSRKREREPLRPREWAAPALLQ
ncbi:hypothetical protein DFH11DRAFT_1875870 [Phellopilus nigrolimitatus]|nr:hypothetical protein DFH11DRAFT_1875870 [Phellopilus nigrolimitatus]